MYIYESHMGGLFATSYELDYEERYCEQCGDSDCFLGYANTKEEVWDLLKDSGWDSEYIIELIDDYWLDEDNE